MAPSVRRRRNWLIGFFLFLALAIAAVVALNGSDPLRVTLVRPEYGAVPEIVTGNSVGTVEPPQTAYVAAEIAGKVLKIHVRQGPVKADQAVFELDARDLEAEREVTRRDIETSRSRLAQAVVRKKKVWEDLERLKQVDVPKGDIERLERDLEIARKDEEIFQLSIRTLEAQLDLLSLKLKKARIAAPFDGKVVKLLGEEGEAVTPGKSLFILHSSGPLLVRVPIDEVDMRGLALGLPSEVGFDGYDKTFPGEVFEITPAASADQKNNRTVDVKVRIPDLPPSILAGMSANVQIITRTKENALRIPTHLIHEDRQLREKYVYVLEAGAARRRRVETGFTNWNTTEIVSGLTTVDPVIVPPFEGADARPLKEGVRVVVAGHGR